ncbi:hypothetical protein BO86DRAFT_205126 [Aspergillus japonicus CBS 114.51]|uniref:F-box domain-containing protein n=2 Tax=Aspergillus TaxID=5052 RepID=A0A2V5HBX0_ASPV1|nr:hypothetical protein BO86DRAFT_205126 [Aspergillus japonicus CBS 114.51]PYI21121.1 hypothetical protein BO99DRAFT_472307 [Aspergillus violaceofuscus CBS 115571]RAH77827.1 hypothetical protein BO86DRAFT_205126 [Aspergillus japonicus CBS 114.51]
MTMAQLETLPTEIVLDILSCIRGPRGVRTLLNLCLTSRRLRDITQPLLFNVLYKYVFDYDKEVYVKRASRIGPLLAFARTLALRPDLGERLLHLCVNANHSPSDSSGQWPAAARNETIGVLNGIIHQMQIPCKLDYVTAINGARINPLIVIIVALAPNLENIDIVSGREGLSCLRPLYLPGPDGKPPYLSSLKSLHLKDKYKMRHPTMPEVVDLMCLPSLKEFSLTFCDGNGSGCPNFELPPGSFKFSELHLIRASLDATRLTNIMRACDHLEVLIYESTVPWDARRQVCQFPARALLPCLEPQRQNIKSLRVDLDVANPIGIPNWHRCPQYGSFRAFENLKHLEVEQGILHDFGNLPSNIETVTVIACDYPVYEMMAGLVEYCKFDFACLRQVSLRPKFPPASGLLGIPGAYSSSDLDYDDWFREHYRVGCAALSFIVDDVPFEFEVECDGWEMYQNGEL